MIKHLQHELARPRLTPQLHQMLLFTKSTLDTQPCDDDDGGGIGGIGNIGVSDGSDGSDQIMMIGEKEGSCNLLLITVKEGGTLQSQHSDAMTKSLFGRWQ